MNVQQMDAAKRFVKGSSTSRVNDETRDVSISGSGFNFVERKVTSDDHHRTEGSVQFENAPNGVMIETSLQL